MKYIYLVILGAILTTSSVYACQLPQTHDYDEVRCINDALISIKKSSHYGVMDNSGQIIIPIQYDNPLYFVDDLAVAYLNNKIQFIDLTGQIVIPSEKLKPYHQVHNFSEGLALVKIGKIPTFSSPKNIKYGYINKQGDAVIKPQFFWADHFSHGLAPVQLHADSRIGFIDPTGKMVIPSVYESVYPFSEGLAAVKRHNRWGYINPQGKVVIDFLFDRAYPFHQGRAIVYLDQYQFIIDPQGKRLAAI